MLTLLHLSDIHFSVFEGESHHDLEEQVREAMLSDIETIHRTVGDMDAVLVVGDLASHGKPEEYELASAFLDRTCDLVGCDRERVICVPGNHDLDRDEQDGIHTAVRAHLRALPAERLSDELHRLLREKRGSEVLLAPLATYNGFALRYGCALAADQLTSPPKQFTLGSRSVLVYGLTSAWICDASDNDKSDSTKVVLGAFQCPQVGTDPEAVTIALVHHPANWLRDADHTTPWLARAHLLLTGHEHAAGITPDGLRRSVAIASGAVNPNRTDSSTGWIPAYNVIRLGLEGPDESDLKVEVHVRCWQKDRAEFGPDDRFAEDPYKAVIRVRARDSGEDERTEVPDSIEPAPPEPIASDVRGMIFEIMRAAPDVRRQAASDLGLIADDTLRGLMLDRHILDRAVAANRVSDLAERIRG